MNGSAQPTEVPEISPTDLQERLEAGDVPVLVDVREAYERRIADLPDHDQIHIPTGSFMARAEEIPRDRDVVVYCRSGSRSEWAARILFHKGYERVFNLEGGVLGWREEVDPSLQSY